jgi:ABC-type antimicrobial peptide transport system permease subunit
MAIRLGRETARIHCTDEYRSAWRLIASMLYGLKSWDPATFALSGALLILVALGASWFPARRAAGVDPMRGLRHE